MMIEQLKASDRRGCNCFPFSVDLKNCLLWIEGLRHWKLQVMEVVMSFCSLFLMSRGRWKSWRRLSIVSPFSVDVKTVCI